MHYKRYQKYGDPLGGGIFRGEDGEINSFLKTLFDAETDDCIPWPFSRDDYGYGKMNRDGKSIGVHRYVCEKANGPRPADYDACHSCGNGHEGCVNPKHLRWGTRLDNVRDMIEHGTANFFGRAA
jgi:hypothetical protein